MALQYRNGHCYLTQSKRVQGKVERKYLGSGRGAVLAYEREQAERQEASLQKQWHRERWQQEVNAAVALDQAVQVVCETAETAFRATMEASGYHQHARSEWRKKRREKAEGENG